EVIRLCRLLEGMPLALELAAAWTPLLTCAEIAAEIERDLSFLRAAARNRPDRQRSLRAVFESSWERLAPAEQAVLAKLAVFSGAFQRAAAIAVSGAALPELLTLAGQSLLRRDAGGRYDMHELLRQYAAEKLAGDPASLAETEVRHSRYYLGLLAAHQTALQRNNQPQSLNAIGEAWENIQTAWQRALLHGDFELIGQAGPSLFLFCDTTSRFQAGETLLQTALDRLQPVAGQARRVAALLAYQGRLLYNQGRYQTARDRLEQSLTLARQEAALDLLAFALHSLGLVAVMQGQYAQAKQLSRESLSLCRQLGDAWGKAWALYTLGWAAYYLGEYPAAQRLTQAGLHLHRRLGNRHGEAACLNTLGLIVCGRYEYHLAQHPEAAAYFEQNLAIRRAIGERWGEATALHNLGYVHFKLGQYGPAQERFEASLALAHLSGALNMQAATGMWLGVTAMEQADYAGAERQLRAALKIASQHGALSRVTDTLYRLGDLWRRQGQVAEALACLTVVRAHPATDERVREGVRLLLAELVDQPSFPGPSRSLDDLVAQILTQ
ncbi:MAG: tetratricopeptide repeat protein, partial [Anaerolineae bacterium]|nr:tetratricopeptide repeat protein [Anaerolineae bacterium]